MSLRFTLCSENGLRHHFFKKYKASVEHSLHVNSNLTAKLGIVTLSYHLRCEITDNSAFKMNKIIMT